MRALVVLTAAPDLKTARSLAKILVVKKAAACVSFREGFTSIYRWQGKVTRACEVLLLIKTSKKNFSKVEALIRRLHPYQIPEILAIPVSGGSFGYLSWLEKNLSRR